MTETDSARGQREHHDSDPPPDEFDAGDEQHSPLSTAPLAQAGLGVVAAVFGIIALVDASGLDMFGKKGVPGPGLFPTVTALAVTVLGLTLVGISVLRRIRSGPGEGLTGVGAEILRAGTVWIGLVICIALMEVIGFVAASALLIAYLVLAVERVRGIKAVLAIVGVPLVAYLLFVFVLGVELPTSAFVEGI
ncbi:tripartite tricarboxylate transporter TctB family protein [Mycobacterium sp. NPDC003449]